MTSKRENPYNTLKSVFHEPNRLSILSTLCTAGEGLTFNALKQECDLTDGNLSRHLKALEEARIVKIKKAFVGVKPQTTVYITDKGRQNFVEYLEALEEVLQKAADSLGEKHSKFMGAVPRLRNA